MRASRRVRRGGGRRLCRSAGVPHAGPVVPACGLSNTAGGQLLDESAASTSRNGSAVDVAEALRLQRRNTVASWISTGPTAAVSAVPGLLHSALSGISPAAGQLFTWHA